ncbi:MAG: ABC transporter ATP-binding protein [Sedimentisphaerales bacterium]|nr:ABC transporter ATP-binding protein [Sedimentisphaerales bacterium]
MVYRSPFVPRAKAVCALTEVSLSVRRGQIVGLIGPNGAGKSTLLSLMGGFILPTRGRVTVSGHPARSRAARRHLGYMPEHPAFLGRYSARAVLRYHAALLGLPGEAIADQVDRSIEQLQMQDFADRACAEFSQGMKQRLALAIALMNEPQVLLLDEPSNGLDPMGIIQLRDLLVRLRDAGASIVVSSHRLSELEKLTSDYLFMHRGRIVTFAEERVARQGRRLHVECLSDGRHVAERVLGPSRVLGTSGSELVIAVEDAEDVAETVGKLARGGARITGVHLQRENVEDVFVRLCRERT